MLRDQDPSVNSALIRITIFASTLLIIGCASVPMAPPAEDRMAKTMNVPRGKALIYVYRNEVFGAAIKLNVLFNGKLIGATVAQSYYLFEVSPGTANVISLAEYPTEMNLDVEANQKYFLWQEVKLGTWQTGSALHRVSETEGLKGVNECKLIKHVKL